jgi:hypothetical protein
VDLDYALLADAAQISQGKTYILGGGVSILHRSDFPAQIGVVLVMQLTYHRTEAETDHQLRIQFMDADGNPVVPEIQGELHVGGPKEDVPMNVRLVAPIVIGFPPFPAIQRPGAYSVEILLDTRHLRSLPLAVVSQAPPQQ